VVDDGDEIGGILSENNEKGKDERRMGREGARERERERSRERGRPESKEERGVAADDPVVPQRLRILRKPAFASFCFGISTNQNKPRSKHTHRVRKSRGTDRQTDRQSNRQTDT
jgi:hypothetical protein